MDRQALQERFGILGDSPALRQALERARQVAASDITVLLEGESGTGKELFASAIHGLSKRRHKKLVVVNCGAIPEGLIESELFGAEKGAYTGSVERRTGYFEEADGGSIFLDEIGEMPLQTQVRLLRVLESGQFSRVGSSQTQTADVRVIAATNKDLGVEVAGGRFREDLYYRLSTVTLRLPPLREREGDVVRLFDAFVRRFAQQYAAPVPRLSPAAVDLVRRYPWPGNVRELRNAAEQTVVLTRESPVSVETLRPFLRGVSAGAGLAVTRDARSEVSERELLYQALLEMRMELREVRALLHHLAGSGAGPPVRSLLGAAATPPAAMPFSPPAAPYTAPASTPGGWDSDHWDAEQEVAYEPPAPYDDHDGVADTPFEIEPDSRPDTLEGVLEDGLPLPTMEEAETALIREALRRFDGNRRETAEALGISERTLYRKIRDLEADDA